MIKLITFVLKETEKKDIGTAIFLGIASWFLLDFFLMSFSVEEKVLTRVVGGGFGSFISYFFIWAFVVFIWAFNKLCITHSDNEEFNRIAESLIEDIEKINNSKVLSLFSAFLMPFLLIYISFEAANGICNWLFGYRA